MGDKDTRLKDFLYERDSFTMGGELDMLRISPIVNYKEHVSPYAENPDKDDWLEHDTSFIWKIGVLAVLDGNKRDWATVYVGFQRHSQSDPQFLGRLSFDEGENCDCGRTMIRIMKLVAGIDIVFKDLNKWIMRK